MKGGEKDTEENKRKLGGEEGKAGTEERKTEYRKNGGKEKKVGRGEGGGGEKEEERGSVKGGGGGGGEKEREMLLPVWFWFRSRDRPAFPCQYKCKFHPVNRSRHLFPLDPGLRCETQSEVNVCVCVLLYCGCVYR